MKKFFILVLFSINISNISLAEDLSFTKIVDLKDGDTQLTLKEITPVRMIKNEFYDQIQNAYKSNASKEELINLLSKGRSKRGMFEGDLKNGELEIGQISASIKEVFSVEEIMNNLMNDFNKQKKHVLNF